MFLARSRAIARHDLRLLRADPAFLVTMTVMPLIVMAFIRPAFQATLIAGGDPDASGAEQVVPGVSVMFALFLVGNLGFNIFREHGWGTWDRLRASPATDLEVMLGKSAVPIVSLGAQQAVLLGVGGLLLGLRVQGSILAFALVAACFAASLVGLGYLLLAVCRTVMQLNGITNLGTMVIAGLGGAITPIDSLPGWAQAIAPIVPSYWAMRGYRTVIQGPGGVLDVLESCAILMLFAVGLSLIALSRFRSSESKVFA